MSFGCLISAQGQIANSALQFSHGSYYSLSLPTDSLQNCTIEVWVNPMQNLDAISLFTIGESDSSGFGLYATTLAGAPEEFAEIKLGGVIESATGNQARLPLNTWTHLALTRTDSIWNLYKNGSLVGRGRRIPKISTNIVIIGKGFIGMMDEIRVWNKERSQGEIRSSMFKSLNGNQDNLLLYYVMEEGYHLGDSILVNKINNYDPVYNAHIVKNGEKPVFILSSLVIDTLPAPHFTLYNFPSHMQFFSRDQNGFAPISISGSLGDKGYDSIVLEKWKNDQLTSRFSIGTHYKNGIAQFSFSDSIHAELSQYTYILRGIIKNTERFMADAADLVAGDAFYICGQSNAHPAIAWYSNINPFFRTFGIQTTNLNFDDYDPADTSWGYGNAHGFGEFFAGPYLIGVWANKLEGNILSSYGIPTCFINGAAGGSMIEQHLPNDSNKLDLTSIYGRGLYRSLKSGLQKSYRALFWYQGEYNSVDGYYNNFRTLYNNWYKDFGDFSNSEILKKIYLFQIHPGCVPGERNALRELQRTLPDSLPNIEVMSTCGTSGHDVCHFDAFGYWHIGDNIFRLVARDFYGSHDTIDIDPPNITKAFYGNSTHDVIILQFPNTKGLTLTTDTLVGGKLRQLKDYFYLDSLSGNINSVIVHGDSLMLHLLLPSKAKHITYLPDETYNNDGADVYEGPWVLNTRGIGALSFNNFPISDYVQDTTISDTQLHLLPPITLQCSPNPVINILTVSFLLPQESQVQFKVLDILGRTVSSFGKRNFGAGENIGSYDLSFLPVGEYFLRMIAGSSILTQKIILIK